MKVNMFKRIMVCVLDIILIFSIIFLSRAVVQQVASASFDTVDIVVVIILLLYIIVDHIILPYSTGFTLSRWLCGYKIVNRGTQENPSFLQCVAQSATLFFIEFLALFGIISLLLLILRKDNATIHDFMSRTEAHGVETMGMIRTLKLLFVSLLILFLPLYSTFLFLSVSDSIYIQPKMVGLNKQSNYIGKPLFKINHGDAGSFNNFKNSIKTEYDVTGLDSSTNVNSDDLDENIRINGQLFKYSETNMLRLGRLMSSLVKLNIVAQNSLLTTDGRYELFSPFYNLSCYAMRWLTTQVSLGDSVLLFSMYDENNFIQCFLTKIGAPRCFMWIIEVTISPKWHIVSISIEKEGHTALLSLSVVIRNWKGHIP